MAILPPAVQRDLDRRIQAAAALIVAEHKRDLSTTFPPASRPGQYPAARTLNLRDAVRAVPIPGGWRVGYSVNAAYILHLAKRGRLTVRDTVARLAPRLRRLLGV